MVLKTRFRLHCPFQEVRETSLSLHGPGAGYLQEIYVWVKRRLSAKVGPTLVWTSSVEDSILKLFYGSPLDIRVRVSPTDSRIKMDGLHQCSDHLRNVLLGHYPRFSVLHYSNALELIQ